METVAEGIEDPSYIETLKRLCCDRIQGYVYAEAMPIEQYIRWLEARK